MSISRKMMALVTAAASLVGIAGLSGSAMAAEPAYDSSTMITLKNAQYGHKYDAYDLGTVTAKSVADDGTATGVSVKTGNGWALSALNASVPSGDDIPAEYSGNPLAYYMTYVSTLADQDSKTDTLNSSGKDNTGADAVKFSSVMDSLDNIVRSDTYGKAAVAGTSGVVKTSGDVRVSNLTVGHVYLVTDSKDETALGEEGKGGVPLLAVTTFKLGEKLATKFSADNAFPNTVFTKSEVKKATVSFKKVDALDKDTPVVGAQFKIEGGALATAQTATSGSDGRVTFEVPFSAVPYTITETSAPDGYKGFFDASKASVTITMSKDDVDWKMVDNTQCSAANNQTESCVNNGRTDPTDAWNFSGANASALWENVPDTSHFPATGMAGSMVFFAVAAGMVMAALGVARVARKRA